METVDDEIRDHALNFIDKAKKDGKPFFCWLNPTRMHIVTHLSPKWEATRNAENGWSEQEASIVHGTSSASRNAPTNIICTSAQKSASLSRAIQLEMRLRGPALGPSTLPQLRPNVALRLSPKKS
jgi:hypothetical protein